MLRESHQLEIESATCKSQVQRPTAEPPRNTWGVVLHAWLHDNTHTHTHTRAYKQSLS